VSWEQLRSIAEANRQYRQEEFSQPPKSCPNDGTPLEASPPGASSSLFCPMGDYRYPDDDHRPAV